MKKFLALVLAVLMIASTVVSVAAFDDVAADNKYATAINELQEYGVVAGKSETEFAPDELVTRWQMALFMARATSGETDDAAWETGASLFTDCTQYLGAIQYCYTKGIIKGVTTTEFAPNANITLRDGVIMAVRALNYEKEDEYVEASAKKYTVTGANYWLPYWQKADEIGMLENLKDLSVTAELTRAQTVQLIYNMLNSVVYNYDVNGYKYTLEEVVFGGKQIVNVDNVTGAWISETPLQSIDADTIGDDEEIVVLTVNDEDSFVTVEVPFEDLEAAGVDVENIEDYFGAYIELVNCRVDYTDRDEDQGVNYIYKEYEYLAGVDNENKLVTTDADVSYHKNEDRIRIGSKTHYFDESEKVRNYLAVYTVNDAANGWELIEDEYKTIWDDKNNNDVRDAGEVTTVLVKSINDQLENKLYDVTFIDTDVDGYYEVALVNYYNIETYKAAKSNGKETCGVMKGEEDVEYSEDLSTDDVFVYTYDPFMNYVDVKGILEVYEGKITGFTSKVEEDAKGRDVNVATVKIDGEAYTLEYIGGEKTVDAFGAVGNVDFIDEDSVMQETNLANITIADVAEVASAYVGSELEYYLFNDVLLALGKEAEVGADNYLVVEEFTDFELYDHVVLSALVDGVEETIKVKKIYSKATGAKKIWADIADLGYGKLANKLEDIFGIYSYTVDDEGYYTLTKYTASLKLNDFVSTVGANTANVINFNDWEVKSSDVLDANNDGNKRDEIIRVNSATTIYLVNVDEEEVDMVKPSSYFSIDVASDSDVTFIIDRIGYGNNDLYYDEDAGVKYGVASILYIITDGEYVDYADYKFVYIDSDLSSVGVGDAASYELETGDEETNYYMYTAEDGEAYLVSTLKDVEEIYVSKDYRDTLGAGKKLPAGVYLLNSENIVVDHETAPTVGRNTLSYGNVTLPYYVWEVNADDINLYDYKYKSIDGQTDHSFTSTNNVQTIKFRFYCDDGVEVYTADKTNEKLVEFLKEYKYNAETATYEDVQVLLVPNTYSGFNGSLSFASNTLNGIVREAIVVD
ncbi:MAG: S-layer homology domain-containing protein [Clostridia bacterium]|nr:S-layer homology domain-containing protein [Clostridia bacterium]